MDRSYVLTNDSIHFNVSSDEKKAFRKDGTLFEETIQYPSIELYEIDYYGCAVTYYGMKSECVISAAILLDKYPKIMTQLITAPKRLHLCYNAFYDWMWQSRKRVNFVSITAFVFI